MSMAEWASLRGAPAGASPRYLMLRVDRADSEHQEGLVDTVNHLGGIGVQAIRQEQRCYQRSRCDAEAHGQLLRSAGDGARVAGRFCADVGINERIHAGELQRLEETVGECQ